MVSVTKRIDDINQPRGGYIKPSQFQKTVLDDKNTLNEVENVAASIVGTVVEYMTKFISGQELPYAFIIPCRGAQIAEEYFGWEGALEHAVDLINEIDGLDDNSIIHACKLVSFDIWYRNPMLADKTFAGTECINPDKETIENIRVMINRSIVSAK